MKLYTGVVAILVESALPLTILGTIYAGIETATLKSVINASADQFLASYFIFTLLFYNFCVRIRDIFRA
ncbi:hypothetical protein EST38_g7493 [Candolleomyces aberdarensis]|uniref:Uncharacterized protein n=1 Tax=Candolleomyces aberdarensis TaxID=2316362 RepID=A0A4Q2DIC3_9AGAR|nr:hypothetical protein EST38_g7493 [Candolleomyces aberdarensis]